MIREYPLTIEIVHQIGVETIGTGEEAREVPIYSVLSANNGERYEYTVQTDDEYNERMRACRLRAETLNRRGTEAIARERPSEVTE